MIERQNYLKIREHLKYLEEVLQLNPTSVDRYRFYLRHLLLWADDQNFRNVQAIRPTLPSYLVSLPGKEKKEPWPAHPKRRSLTLANASFVGQSLHTQEK